MDLWERASTSEKLIRDRVRETPLEWSEPLSGLAGFDVSLKLENFQETGSFKLRGVYSKLMSEDGAALRRGVVTASTGNHGLATAYAAADLGIEAQIVVPEGASGFRLERLVATGVMVTRRGSECSESEAWARAEAERTGRLYLSPYNDIDVVAGQGTIAVEMMRQAERIDLLAATVGGGGLISGVGGALKDCGLALQVLGCLPENSPAMYESVREGRLVRSRVLPTLSDSSAGNVEEGSITFDLCRKYVDQWALVPEEAILSAMKLIYDGHDMVVEGAAATAVAGFLQRFSGSGLNRGTHAVIIICGGNVGPEQFADVVVGDEGPSSERDQRRAAGG